MGNNNSIVYILLSSAVFAALITSITNLIISLINNRRLKKLEKEKSKSEINQYRYSRLYEVLLNWEKYESEPVGKDEKDIFENQIHYKFSNNIRRYSIIRPLLDEPLTTILDLEKISGENLFSDLSDIEFSEAEAKIFNRDHTPNVPKIKYECLNWTMNFSELLIAAINDQLKILLDINNLP